MDLTKVTQQIASQQDDLLELVKQLVAFETPAPPARNTREAQNFVADYLRPLGFDIDQWALYDNDDIVVGTKNGDSTYQSLIINGHIDVASLNPDEQWSFSPFETVIQDDRLIGRGVSDMKGGLAAALFALKTLHDQNISLPGKVLFESVIGEELMEKQEMKTLIEDAYADVLNNLKVEKIERYFDTQYLQTTDSVNSTFNQFKQHIVALQKVTRKIQVTEFQEEMFDVENQKIFLHYVVNVTKIDGKVGHVEVFAVFTVNENKIVRCEELTRALDDKTLNDLGSKQ